MEGFYLPAEYPEYETEGIWFPEEPKRSEKKAGSRLHKDADGFYRSSRETEGPLRLRLIGDLMCEPRMSQAYRYGTDFFFQPAFSFVRDLLSDSDLTVANLETTLSERTPYAADLHTIWQPGADRKRYHCNGPKSYLDAIRFAGFDVLVNANNHNMDSGMAGLFETLDALDAKDFPHTGAYRPGKDRERFLLFELKGIRLAVLSYTNFVNAKVDFATEKGKNEALNLYSPEKAAEDIAAAREKGAELVLVYMHWGVEYHHEHCEEQKEQAESLVRAGADAIIGSHTHCLEDWEILTASSDKKVPVFYSLGNFITNEASQVSKHTGILQLEIGRSEEGFTLAPSFIPCFVFEEFCGCAYAPVPAGRIFRPVSGRSRESVEQYVSDILDLPFIGP